MVHELPVDVDAITRDADSATNYQLLPGDRIFVNSHLETDNGNDGKLGEILPSPTASRRAATVRTNPAPWPIPPAPRLASTYPPTAARSPQQIKFSIIVIEDTSRSLEEFESLQNTLTFVGDRDSTLGMLRILHKNKLIDVLSRPAILGLVGREMSVKISGVKETNSTQPPSGIDIRLRPQGGSDSHVQLFLEASVVRNVASATRSKVSHGVASEVTMSLDIEYGKTVIVKVGAAETSEAAPIYIALTPERVE